MTKVWNKLDSLPPRLRLGSYKFVTEQYFWVLPTDQHFIDLIYLGIEGGSQSPFIALYAASMYESFNHQEMWRNCYPQENSLQCINIPSSQIY